METVKVAREFDIPKKIRAALELKPGEELQICVLDRSIPLQRPLEHPRSIKELRGIAKGMHWKMIIVTAATGSELVVPGLATL